MSLAGAASTGFSGGRVFTRTVEAIQANILEFGKIGIAFFAAPALILGLVMLPYQRALFTGGAPSLQGSPGGLVGLIGLACGLIGYAALIWGYWAYTGGRKPSFQEMLKAGTGNALPVLLTGVLMVMGIAVGFVLLFVPGVILAVMWCVAVPAQVVEKPQGLGAFARSRALTRGVRWAIFGMFLLYVLAATMVSILIALGAGIGTGFGLLGFLSGPVAILRVILQAIEQGVFGVFGAVFASALYYELRSVKEGLAPESLASVFE